MDLPEEAKCEICNHPSTIPEKKWFTHCRRNGCKNHLILRNLENINKRYTIIRCEKTKWRCVDKSKETTTCGCCPEQPVRFYIDDTVRRIRTGQKVYGSEKVTGYVSRRMEELKEMDRQLASIHKELQKNGISLPKDKKKSIDAPKLEYPVPWRICKSTCDYCGKKGTIYPGSHVVMCKNTSCKRIQFRMVRPGLKYVSIQCKESWGFAVRESALVVNCLCCKGEYAIDSIVAYTRNNQPVFATVKSSPFIKQKCQELYDTINKLKAARKALKKHQKKNKKKASSIWDLFSRKNETAEDKANLLENMETLSVNDN